MREFSRLKTLKVVAHILFWVLYSLFYFYLIIGRFPVELAINRTLLMVLIQLPLVYLNIFIFIPKLFVKKKYFIYIFSILLLLIASNVLFELIIEARPELFNINYEFHRIPPPPPKLPGTKNIINYLLSIFLLLLSTLVEMASIASQKEKETAELKGDRLNAELKFLKSQINPHFLFNTLNNLYALSLTQSEKTSEVILQLSEMLKYNLYEASNKEKVNLLTEIEYIKNYIHLFQLKDEPLKEQISFEYELTQTAELAPMLLIPFVENAFKHSDITNNEKAKINIQLNVVANKLKFQITNSQPTHPQEKDHTGGIGIENVKRRLNLLYPDQHKLTIESTKNAFQVYLEIKLT